MNKFFTISIVVVGILLRIFALGARHVWFDEAFTYHIAKLPLNELIFAVGSDNNPPLYYILIHYMLKLGRNEVILRLPSLLFSIASLPLLYAVGKEHINRGIGLIAALLFALSPLAMYQASEARLHGLALFLELLLIYLFLILLKKPRIQIFLSFIFVSVLGIYTQYYIFLLFLPFTWIIMRHKARISIAKWLIILFTILIAFSPWLLFALKTSHSECACPHTILSLPASIVSPVLAGVGNVTLRTFPTLPFPLLALFSAAALFTLFFFLKGLTAHTHIALLYMIPLAILSFFGLFLPVFSPKAFAIFTPLYFLIVASGLNSIKRKHATSILLLASLTAISIIQTVDPFFAGDKLKSVYTVVRKDSSIPIAHTSVLTYYSLAFYTQSNTHNILITQNPLSPATVSFIGGRQEALDEHLTKLWLVDTEKWVEKNDRQAALKNLFKEFAVEATYQIDKISIRSLERK